MSIKLIRLAFWVSMTLVLTAPAFAQEKPRLIGSYGDWDALQTRSSKQGESCYIISQPTKWTASKKDVRRGDIYLTVTHRPKFKIIGEINTIVGYPLQKGSEVQVSVDNKRATRLFTEDRGAWAYDPQDDQRLVELMKAGATMAVSAISSRGTTTKDTYSLRGFTAAYNAITRACR